MDAETQAVYEMMEISYQGTRYLLKFIAGAVRHGTHGAAALVGLIQSALKNKRSKNGPVKMGTLLKNSNGLASFSLDIKDYEIFKTQAAKMKILYVPIRAETNPDMLTIVTGAEQAPLANQIITINNLNGIMNGVFEQAQPPQVIDMPEQTSEVKPGTPDGSDSNSQTTAHEEPENPQAAKDSEDFFSSFGDQDEPEPPEPDGGEKTEEDFFAAFEKESSGTVLSKEEVWGSENQATRSDIYEVDFVEIAAEDLRQQPAETVQSLQIAGYLPAVSEAAKENPIQPEQMQDHLSGNALRPLNGSGGILSPERCSPERCLPDSRPSVRDKIQAIKAGTAAVPGLPAKSRELIPDKKLPARNL